MPPRRRKPRPEATRCSYSDGRRRCQRAGQGAPCLCATHRVMLEEAATAPKSALGDFLSDLMGGKKIDPQKAGAAAAEVLGAMFAGAAAAGAARGGAGPGPFPWRFDNPPMPGGHGPRAAPRQPPPPQVDEEAVKRTRARKILAFAPGQKLTVEIIRKRQRELAKRFHPDLHPPDKRAEAERKMTLITGAAALLMDDLR